MAIFVDWNKLIFGDDSETYSTSGFVANARARRDGSAAPAAGVNAPELTSARDSIPSGDRSHGSSLRPHFTTAALILLGTFLIWLWLGRKRRRTIPLSSDPTTQQLQLAHEEAIDTVKRECSQRIDAMEKSFGDALRERIRSLEEQFQQATAVIEDNVRKGLHKRVESLEVRIKLDQEALEDLHRALAQRIGAFEEYVKTIDSKQLDQEANTIVQRDLGSRLEAAESQIQTLDGRTRSSTQRIEAMDDLARVIDSRSKALSQRVEAVEDNQNEIDGQVTLLSHDMARGSAAVEKLQKLVKKLPDGERFEGMSRNWEAKVQKLEARIEEFEKTMEEEKAARELAAASLTYSQVETQEIEPVRRLYTSNLPRIQAPRSFSYETPLRSPSVASSSVHSYSTGGGSSSSSSGSHRRTYSTASSDPPCTPELGSNKKLLLDNAGFQDTTFASRQKRLQHRPSWMKG
ncbi:hypothetical protein F4780DRAFT_750207 [Xylariomycetidae sp. FL0641]|nr:hypothetical protein F4780DRAFT_750207 [Xylariomycetidae sp. FL0641]